MHVKIFKILLLPISLLFALSILLLRPIFLIRLCLIADHRIGHFVKDLTLYYLEKKEKKNKGLNSEIDIFCFNDNKYISNLFIKKKWSEKLNFKTNLIIQPTIKIIQSIYKILKKQNPHAINLTEENKLDIIKKNKPIFSFSEDEKKIGNLNLKKMGIKENSKFILLLIRDESYLFEKLGNKEGYYHSYRNLDIQNFIDVTNYFISKGYYVIRMGKIVKKKFPLNNNKFIDYPFSSLKSDFMDVYLSANCEFALSTLTGIDNLPEIFHKPTLGIEYPIDKLNIFNKCKIFTTPIYTDRKSKKILTVNEVLNKLLNSNFKELNSNVVDSLDIKLVHNSKEEILEAGKEMILVLENTKVNFETQSNFWNNLIYFFKKKNLNYSKENISSKISNNFFIKYKRYLEN